MVVVRSAGVFGVILLAACASKALADGAVAFGRTGDLAKDGFALGYSVNSPTTEQAKASALKQCFEFKGSDEKAKAACKLVGTLKNECLAVHYDPEVGRPGVGWGIGPDSASAVQRSLANCHKTAGKNRQKFCRHDRTVCDGSAK